MGAYRTVDFAAAAMDGGGAACEGPAGSPVLGDMVEAQVGDDRANGRVGFIKLDGFTLVGLEWFLMDFALSARFSR